ncbi:MAG TPA: NAD-dependent deacylase [Candidatus Sulfomarinibacteraceae bacterium]|nr:NAD-dependent deacylase [Candidatus Sulfomarinibacteraceae bacterium]
MNSYAIPTPLIRSLRRAQHVVVLTGAGISAESGIPTFRDAQTGLWAQYDPEELATPQAFRRNPQLVWDWYRWRRSLVKKASPNPAHHALVMMEQKTSRLTVVTQNVDGLHEQAGSSDVLELHGNIMRARCSAEEIVVAPEPGEGATDDELPHCPNCGALLRPDVVWFGEPLPEATLRAATAAIEACDLLLCVGTSALVHPAASLPFLAIQRGTSTAEINPQETPLSQWMDFELRGPAGAILPALVAQTWPDVAVD